MCARCWVKSADDFLDDDKEKRAEVFVWEMFGGKIVEWFTCVVFCPIIYLRCWILLSRQEELSRRYDSLSSHGASSQRTQSEDGPINFTQFKRKLFFVPIILFFLRLPGSAVTVMTYFFDDDRSVNGVVSTLKILQSFCDPLQGFFNGVLFVACNSTTSQDEEGVKRTGCFQMGALYSSSPSNDASLEAWQRFSVEPLVLSESGASSESWANSNKVTTMALGLKK